MQELFEQGLVEYERWQKETSDDFYMQHELSGIKGNSEEIANCFCTELQFGTSGIRGIMGPGPGRLNIYVIRKITQGFSNFLKKKGMDASVVIAYDGRHFSQVFAEETASVLSGNGIKSYIFDEITPVPVLSYSIDKLSCDYGIIITASHNACIFNGYKIYNSKGYQLVGEEVDLITQEIESCDYFSGINKSTDLITSIDDTIHKAFLDDAISISKGLVKGNPEALKVIYTPLNGAGNKLTRSLLKGLGFTDVIVVPSQENQDENFTTCKAPNPERLSAYNEAFKVLDSEKGDIIIATDPDSDRVGAALIHDGTKRLLTGNQLGILMLDHLSEERPPKVNQKSYRSIVSSPLFDRLAESSGLDVVTTLTGFKYIGEAISDMMEQDKENEFYFGFEESNGFLFSPFIRDKDGISSAALIASMACKQKARGKDLIDRLEEIYDDYGLLIDKSRSFTFEGLTGIETMNEIMEFIRGLDENIGDLYIEDKLDYLYDDTDLPKSNVVRFDLDDGSTVIIRPSGTEPKIKVYMFLSDPTSQIEKEIIKIFDQFKQDN